jgi:predicted component of type VI protein secretion system
MPDLFAELANALRERLAVIADRDLYARDPAAHLEKLKAASERITQLADALPRPLPGDFAHYLQRASYQKALDWIDANMS